MCCTRKRLEQGQLNSRLFENEVSFCRAFVSRRFWFLCILGLLRGCGRVVGNCNVQFPDDLAVVELAGSVGVAIA